MTNPANKVNPLLDILDRRIAALRPPSSTERTYGSYEYDGEFYRHAELVAVRDELAEALDAVPKTLHFAPEDFEPYEYYSENGYLEGFCEVVNEKIETFLAEAPVVYDTLGTQRHWWTGDPIASTGFTARLIDITPIKKD